MVTGICNLITWEAEAGQQPQVQGWLGLHRNLEVSVRSQITKQRQTARNKQKNKRKAGIQHLDSNLLTPKRN